MFLGGIDAGTGRFQAPGFIVQKSWRRPVMQGRETQLSVLAQPGFDQVAAIIVQAHRYQVPIDHNVQILRGWSVRFAVPSRIPCRVG